MATNTGSYFITTILPLEYVYKNILSSISTHIFVGFVLKKIVKIIFTFDDPFELSTLRAELTP
jgi:hypothetical protein